MSYSLKGIESPNSEFPLHNLPVEIIEHIINIDEEMAESIRPLLCVSRQLHAIKGKIKWGDSLKRKKPLKYKIIEQSLAQHRKDFDWDSYYFKFNRADSNWAKGKYTEVKLPGYPHSMNEEVILCQINRIQETSRPMRWHLGDEISSEAPGYGCYWFRLADLDKKDEPLDAYYLGDILRLSSGLVLNSDPMAARIAVANWHDVDFYEGTHKIASCPYEGPSFSSPMICRGDRLFLGYTEITLDERLTSRRIYQTGAHVVDMSLFNGQRLCFEKQMDNPEALFVRDKKHELIGPLLLNSDFNASRAAFLDEHNVVVCYYDSAHQYSIGYVDTRKLGEIYYSFEVDEIVDFDAPNQRATGDSTWGIMNVYDLKLKRLQTAIQRQGHGRVITNSRYFARNSLFDFGI